MKKNLNIIQINGFRGILLISFIATCLAAGFIWFPGWVSMHLWNYSVKYFEKMPCIGIVQGMLLWGILVASYFTFRKEKLVVCMRASDGLSEEELKKVFADIKHQTQMDPVLRNMIKARETEMKIKHLNDITNTFESDTKCNNEQEESVTK